MPIIEEIQTKITKIENVVINIDDFIQNLSDTLEMVGDIASEIDSFFSTIYDLIDSDIFGGKEFDNFIEFFTGKKFVQSSSLNFPC